MKQLVFFSLLIIALLNSCSPQKIKKHVFYLHGRIIELQGLDANHAQYGKYEFENILAALEAPNHILYAEVRDSLTDVNRFCRKISNQIDSLIAEKVDPKNICVIGASKGGVMAMQISDQNPNPIKYVLLGANNSFIEAENDWNLKGYILGFYESTDQIADADYSHWLNRSPDTKKFIQVEITTGKGHGFLYQAHEEWVKPTLAWLYY